MYCLNVLRNARSIFLIVINGCTFYYLYILSHICHGNYTIPGQYETIMWHKKWVSTGRYYPSIKSCYKVIISLHILINENPKQDLKCRIPLAFIAAMTVMFLVLILVAPCFIGVWPTRALP